MAEFQKVMADAKRMYTQIGDGNYPLYIGEVNFERFEKEVEQWAAEHPVRTNRMVLKEDFPKYNVHTVCMVYFTDKQPKGGCNAIDCGECREQWLDAEYKGGEKDGES